MSSFNMNKSGLRFAFIALLSFGLMAQQSWARSSGPDLGSLEQIQGQNPGQQQPSDLDERMRNQNYPIHPDDQETPGDLCNKSTTYRYPEHIKYCSRNVDSSTKNQIIAHYDKVFGYRIQAAARSDFKIDHLIPLCLGGSNEVVNLWPQHKKVYEITDPLEPEICNKLSQGKVLQKDAVELVIYAKHHLGEVAAILQKVKEL